MDYGPGKLQLAGQLIDLLEDPGHQNVGVV
jgi:hypothetical protein